MMEHYHGHQWHPITGLHDWESLADPSLSNVVAAWHDRKEQLHSLDSYHVFLQRLRREWAIETGIIERLYTLSEGATKTLIEKGLDAALIGSDDTDRPVRQVIAHIHDQYQALEGLNQFLDAERPLGTSFIKELHGILTAHQRTCEAIDSLGHYVQTELVHGAWKKLPNNVLFPDGTRFEYCPPEQVDLEMEQLVKLYQEYDSTGIAPDALAAWLHHRFTLIHPFQDGNGRVARCLATLVFLKANWFPLVITRHERTRYVDSLRSADKGDLKPLVELFGGRQSRAAIEAMSLSEHFVSELSSLDESLAVAAKRIEETLTTKGVRALQSTADSLLQLAYARMRELTPKLNEVVQRSELDWSTEGSIAPRDSGREHYYWREVCLAASQLGYIPNERACQCWARVIIITDRRTHLLVSFHGLGRGYSGVFACLPLLFDRQRDWSAYSPRPRVHFPGLTPEPPPPRAPDPEPVPLGETIKPLSLSDEPFLFSVRDTEDLIVSRFQQWLDTCLSKGISRWAESL